MKSVVDVNKNLSLIYVLKARTEFRVPHTLPFSCFNLGFLVAKT